MATNITPQNASEQAFIPVMRELTRAYQFFASYDAAGFRNTHLTVPQADVIFAVGNAGSLTFKEIGEITLITKGTLTGIIDRLEAKGLVHRVAKVEDRRCTRVMLTVKGERLFNKEFPRQMAHLKQRFDRLSPTELSQLLSTLKKFCAVFE